MPSTARKTNKITKQLQANHTGNVLEHRLMIQNATKGKRSGPQRARPCAYDKRAVLPGSVRVIEVDGDSYSRLPNGKLLQENWMDVYEWFTGVRAPKDWLVGLNRTVPDTFSVNDMYLFVLEGWCLVFVG